MWSILCPDLLIFHVVNVRDGFSHLITNKISYPLIVSPQNDELYSYRNKSSFITDSFLFLSKLFRLKLLHLRTYGVVVDACHNVHGGSQAQPKLLDSLTILNSTTMPHFYGDRENCWHKRNIANETIEF